MKPIAAKKKQNPKFKSSVDCSTTFEIGLDFVSNIVLRIQLRVKISSHHF